MSNAFTNFLGGVAGGVFDNTHNLKDYQHADRLYVRNTYARAPKFGFLYFVSFNINEQAVGDQKWIGQKGMRDVGLLVKRLDLPKFTITNEIANQYNRKTVVQSKLNYSPVNMDFHDDNSDITTNLWKNYYKYYFADSAYGDGTAGTFIRKGNSTTAFSDTKYGTTDYAYGLSNNQTIPFFKSIDIYVMHQQKFTRITLVNPIVTEWAHDSLDQAESTKTLHSKMTVAYEDVLYESGLIQKGEESGAFRAVYYDTSPSPLSIAGNGNNSLFGAGGVLAGASSLFGGGADNPLAALIQANNLRKNIQSISKNGLKAEGLSVLTGVLGEIAATGNQPGGVAASREAAISNSPGLGIAINLFKNSSVDGTTTATPSKLTTKK